MNLQRRAGALGIGEIVDCTSLLGGGSLPGIEIPPARIAFGSDITAELRQAPVPGITRVSGQRTIVDLRTVGPAEDGLLAAALVNAAAR